MMFLSSYLLHLQSFGGFIIVDPASIKQKPDRENSYLDLSIDMAVWNTAQDGRTIAVT